jgi:hypothetical protein
MAFACARVGCCAEATSDMPSSVTNSSLDKTSDFV